MLRTTRAGSTSRVALSDQPTSSLENFFFIICFAIFANFQLSRRKYRAAAKKVVVPEDTNKFRRRLMKSDRYFRNLRNPQKSMEDLKERYGSEILDKIRKNDYRLDFGDVRVILARANGFCWGVERAVSIAREAKAAFPQQTIWLTNEIIHNPRVNEDLSFLGLSFIPKSESGEKDFSVVQEGNVVVLPAFGATVEEMKFIQDRGATIVDATCPWVSKVWNAVEKHKKSNFTSIIHGKKNHEESIATASFAGAYLILLDINDTKYVANYMLNGGSKEEFLNKFKGAYSQDFDPDTCLDYIGIANQTTMLKGDTEEIAKILRDAVIEKFGTSERFMHFNTICDATQERQDAIYEMLGTEYSGKDEITERDVDFVLIVGGFNSSNTQHLLEIVLEGGIRGYHVDDSSRIGGKTGFENAIRHKPFETASWRAMQNEGLVEEKFIPKGKFTVAITSGASTPDNVLEACLLKILSIHEFLEETGTN